MEIENKNRPKNVDYKLKFAKEKYKRIPLDIPIELAEKWKNAAKMAGIPLNTLIKSAVNEKIESLEKSLDTQADESGKALLDDLSD